MSVNQSKFSSLCTNYGFFHKGILSVKLTLWWQKHYTCTTPNSQTLLLLKYDQMLWCYFLQSTDCQNSNRSTFCCSTIGKVRCDSEKNKLKEERFQLFGRQNTMKRYIRRTLHNRKANKKWYSVAINKGKHSKMKMRNAHIKVKEKVKKKTAALQ